MLSSDGAPIANAAIELRGMRTVLTARSAGDGTFVLRGVAPGGYSIGARAAGYTGAGTRSIDVRAGSKNDVDITLNPSPDSLVTIGHVRVNGGETLSTSSAPSVDLDAQSYAERGYTRVSDMLNGVLGLSLIRPAGGNAAAPAVASLRGPDPTETLIDIDGHEMNMANSGAFDLSLLDPADFSNAQVVYGISPSSLVGANTIGGAINLRTLEPTADSRALLRVAAGSFGTFGETVQTTGTKDRIGYAFSLHRTTSQGDVNLDDVGSAIAATNALAKLRYTFARGGFATVTFRDSSIFKDESAALSAVDPASEFTSFAGSAVLAHNAGYGFDLQLPLGKPQADGIVQTTALFRHLTALTSQSVTGPASGSSPYFFNDRDLTGDDTLEIDRMLSNGVLSAKFGLRNEALDTQISLGAEPEARARRPMDDGAPEAALPFSTLAQKQRSFALRYAVDATPKLHYALAGYYSWFERYGTSFDPRAGIVWTPTPRSALRFSIGTTFQAPELTELYVPPELPPPDAGGHIDIGNPHLKPDRATEFDLGYEHIFGVSHRTHASIDLYRTNLRGSAQRYLPAATCTDDSTPAEQQHCVSYPINIGLAVYQGMELRFDRDLDAQTTIHAGYGLNSAYPASVPPQVQDGTLVAGQQFLGLPLHKATLSLERDAQAGLGYNIGFVYEGANNALNRPPFAMLNAALTWRSSHFDVTLAGTNLSNVYADRFTRSAAGVAYPGAFGPIPTDAYALQGAAFTLSVTRRY